MSVDRTCLLDMPAEWLQKYDDIELIHFIPVDGFAGFKLDKRDNKDVAMFITEEERDKWVARSDDREPLTEDEAWKRLNVETECEEGFCEYWWDKREPRVRWVAPLPVVPDR